MMLHLLTDGLLIHYCEMFENLICTSRRNILLCCLRTSLLVELWRLMDDDSIDRFIFGCPVLEELSMDECVGENVSFINIVAPTLMSLFMHDCLLGYVRPPHGSEREIVLDTPALLYLTIRDSAADDSYIIENLHHLIRADICLYADDDSDISEALTDLLTGISIVEFLQFGFSIQTYMRDWQLPEFPNMTCLELGEIFDVQWEFLLELLENSPHLETLVFKEGLGDDYEVVTQLLRDPAQNVPSCLLSHLKEIEIRYFGGEKEEWEIVNYFLQKAKVLEKVNIGFGGSNWTIHASRT